MTKVIKNSPGNNTLNN